MTSEDPNKSALPGQWVFYGIAAVGILMAFLLWHALVLQFDNHLKKIIQLQTEHVASDINTQFEFRITALKHLAKHLEREPDSSYVAWEKLANIFIGNHPTFQVIGWINPAKKAVWLFPNKNAALQKQALDFITKEASRFKNTTIPSRIWLSSTLNLATHEKGFYAVLPVSTPTKGMLVALFDVKHVFNIPLSAADYSIIIKEDGVTIFQSGGPPFDTRSVSPLMMGLYGTQWAVYIYPSAHLIDTLGSTLPFIALLLGICIAILLAVAACLVSLIRERARSLKRINNALTREINERMQAEDSKQKLEKALQQGQKLQAIGTLAGGIAHDFNNILYAIIGYVEMALEDTPNNSITHRNLGKVLEASQRGRDLIARILGFGRKTHHEFKKVLLKQTIENALSLLQPAIPTSVSINTFFAIPDSIAIWGDQTRLHQIIVNIITNAVDSMDGDGIINIILTNEHNQCKIEISDNGHGMDQSTIERIFEPFFTTKEVGKGTGLGLATVHAIVKEHQGEIQVISQLGVGSTFTILLPEYRGVLNEGDKYGEDTTGRG